MTDVSLCGDCTTEIRDCPWMLTGMKEMCPGQAVRPATVSVNSNHCDTVYITLRCELYRGNKEQGKATKGLIADPAQLAQNKNVSRPRKQWTEGEVKKLVELREAGHSWVDIGRELDVTVDACRRKYRHMYLASLKKRGKK